MNWAAAELDTLDLGDPRLDRRAVLMAERLARRVHPEQAKAAVEAATVE
ncbi:transposase [Chitinivorax sp. B]|nr:transposase [Chitinivorax sp. B]